MRQKDSTGALTSIKLNGQGRVKFKPGSGNRVRVKAGWGKVRVKDMVRGAVPVQGQKLTRGHDQLLDKGQGQGQSRGHYQGQGQKHGQSQGQGQGLGQGQGQGLEHDKS